MLWNISQSILYVLFKENYRDLDFVGFSKYLVRVVSSNFSDWTSLIFKYLKIMGGMGAYFNGIGMGAHRRQGFG